MAAMGPLFSRATRAGLLSAFAVMATIAGATQGCVEINGGAVEVPWTVFAEDGRGAINDCNCTEPAIMYVRLKLEAPLGAPDQPDPCAGSAACRFSCQRKTGATPFMIPPGTYQLSIEPETADGLPIDPGLVMVPAPITREVVRGAAAELDALQITAPCAVSCSGGDMTKACSRG